MRTGLTASLVWHYSEGVYDKPMSSLDNRHKSNLTEADSAQSGAEKTVPWSTLHMMLESFEQPALITNGEDAIYAFNSEAERALMLSDRTAGHALGDVLSRIAIESERVVSQVSQREATESAEGTEFLAPVRIRGVEREVAGMWSMKPLKLGGKESLLLHRFFETSEEEVDRTGLDILANVSHELRTPLSALVATTEVMLQDYQSISMVELGQMIGLLHRNTRRLESLVSNLLDAAGLQNGRLQLRKSANSISALIREASESVIPLLDIKNQRLETKTVGELPVLVVDSRRIVGVLVNLLSNAGRYGLPNEPISLIVVNEKDGVRFTVRQRGPGIPRHEQALLFQRFYRSSAGEKMSGGTGLGLAIVKDIVELHGGTVGLVSRPGRSTAFWFTLPIEGVAR